MKWKSWFRLKVNGLTVKRNEYRSALFMHRPMRLITLERYTISCPFDKSIPEPHIKYYIRMELYTLRMSQCRRIPGPHARQPPTLGRRIRRAVSPSPAKSPSLPYLSVHSYLFPSVLLIQYRFLSRFRSWGEASHSVSHIMDGFTAAMAARSLRAVRNVCLPNTRECLLSY